MKKILALLMIAGCASKPLVLEKPQDLANELKKTSSVVANEALRAPKLSKLSLKSNAFTADAVPASKLIGMSPVTADPYLGWVKTSVGFAKGEMTEQALQGLGLDLPYSWRVLKKWDDGTVRIGQFKTVGYFTGLGIVPVNLFPGKTPKPYFAWHPAVWNAILGNNFVDGLKINFTATQGVSGAGAQQVSCVPASGAYKFMVADTTEFAIRFRSSCFNRVTQAVVPIYLTSYFTFMSDDPVVRIQHVIGNDQMETPVMGGWSISGVEVAAVNLPTVRWVNESSYGNKSFALGDGQQMTFKTVIAMDPGFNTTALQLSTGQPFGFQYYPEAQASLAFGTSPLPTTRVTGATLTQAHNEVNNGARFPNAQSSDWLGMIDQNPPSTGAQSDFASTAPLEIQKAQQAYSSRQLAAVALAVSRESFRPQHFFKAYEFVKNTEYPDLFFWSSRIHYDFSWNTQYPDWRPRTNQGGFVAGAFSGWGSDDNQHVSHNTLRHLWELSGGLYEQDLLQSYISIAHFDFFTDWVNTPEAERAWGRMMKHAIALTELFPDLPETALLKSRFPAKIAAYSGAVSLNLQRFGNPVPVPFDGCDQRVNNGVWCGAQNAFGQGPFVAVGWQQGFVFEAMTMYPNPDLRVLAAAETYYTPNGTLKTYFPAPTPNDFTTGGIGVEWQSGWVQLALKYPNAPGAQFILNNVKPVLEARTQNGCGFPSFFFCLNDGFRAW